MNIPVLDFAKCAINLRDVNEKDLESIGEEIYDVFSNTGFVYLRNTGIASDQVKSIFSTAKKFFELDSGLKAKFARDSDYYGYIAVCDERLDPEKPGDLREAFNVTGRALVKPDTYWPDEYVADFSNAMRAFAEVCRQLTMRLLEALSSGMKLQDKEYFAKSHARINDIGNLTTLRSLYYPSIPDGADIKPGQTRLGVHSDYGSFALLFQDDVGGLQVECCDGKFVEAVPIPDTILVNIGDILEFWTNGRLKSTRHKIPIPEDKAGRDAVRRSIAFFVHPDDDVILSEIEYGASSKNHRQPEQCKREEPVSAFDFVMRRVEKIYK